MGKSRLATRSADNIPCFTKRRRLRRLRFRGGTFYSAKVTAAAISVGTFYSVPTITTENGGLSYSYSGKAIFYNVDADGAAYLKSHVSSTSHQLWQTGPTSYQLYYSASGSTSMYYEVDGTKYWPFYEACVNNTAGGTVKLINNPGTTLCPPEGADLILDLASIMMSSGGIDLSVPATMVVTGCRSIPAIRVNNADANLTIDAGFTGKVASVSCAAGTLSIAGGLYTATSVGVVNAHLASGYTTELTGDDTYKIKVVEGTAPPASLDVAVIGEEKYVTLMDAIAEVAEGQTITLIANASESAAIATKSGVAFTLDLNGKTYTNKALDTDGNTFTVHGSMTLVDSAETKGSFNVKRIKNAADGVLNNSSVTMTVERLQSFGQTVVNGGVLNINLANSSNPSSKTEFGLYVYGETMTVCGGAVVTIPNNDGNVQIGDGSSGNGTLTITGSGTSVSVAGVSTGLEADGTLKVLAGATLTSKGIYHVGAVKMDVSGAKIVNTGDTWGYDNGRTLMVDLTGATKGTPYQLVDHQGSWTVTLMHYGTLSCANGSGTFSVTDGSLYVTETDPVCQIGDTPYGTLAGAISALTGGETIKLLTDTTVDSTITVTKSVKIDLAGKVVTVGTGSSNYSFVVDMGAEGSVFEVTNGVFRTEGADGWVGGLVQIADSCKPCGVVFGSVTVRGTAEGDKFLGKSDSDYRSLFSDLSTVDDAFTFVNCNIKTEGVILKSFLQPGARAWASLNITGGTYEGSQGFRFRGGKTSVIAGATITSTSGIALYPNSDTVLTNSVVRRDSWNNGDAIAMTGNGNAELRIYDSTVESKSKSAVAVESLGTVRIYSGTFVNTADASYSDKYPSVLRVSTTGGAIYVTGGEFTGDHYALFADSRDAGSGKVDASVAKIEVMDGVFSGKLGYQHKGQLFLEGGRFTCVVGEATGEPEGCISITGGIHSRHPINDPSFASLNCVPSRCEVKDNTDPVTMAAYPFAVRVTPYCEIGDKPYGSIAAAISAATGGETIKLVANTTVDSTITVDKDVTIDLAGYDITVSDAEYAFAVAGANFTIKDSTYTTTVNSEILGAGGTGLIKTLSSGTPSTLTISDIAIHGGEAGSTTPFTTATGGSIIYDANGNTGDSIILNNTSIYTGNALVSGNVDRDVVDATLTVTGGCFTGSRGFLFTRGTVSGVTMDISTTSGSDSWGAAVIVNGTAVLTNSTIDATSMNDAGVIAYGKNGSLSIYDTTVRAHGQSEAAVGAQKGKVYIYSGTFSSDATGQGDGNKVIKAYRISGSTTSKVYVYGGVVDGSKVRYGLAADGGDKGASLISVESKSGYDAPIIIGGTEDKDSGARSNSSLAKVELGAGVYQGVTRIYEDNAGSDTEQQWVRITGDVTLDVANGGQFQYGATKGSESDTLLVGEHTSHTIKADLTGVSALSVKLIDYIGSGTKTLDDYGMVTLDGNENGLELTVIDNDLIVMKVAAKIGDKKYESIAAAVAAVPAGGTVTIINAAAVEPNLTVDADKAFVLDLNGKTLATALTVAGSSVTLSNGTVKATVTVSDGALYVIDGVKIVADKAIDVTGGVLNVTGGIVQGTATNAVFFAAGSQARIAGGTFLAPEGVVAIAYNLVSGQAGDFPVNFIWPRMDGTVETGYPLFGTKIPLNFIGAGFVEKDNLNDTWTVTAGSREVKVEIAIDTPEVEVAPDSPVYPTQEEKTAAGEEVKQDLIATLEDPDATDIIGTGILSATFTTNAVGGKVLREEVVTVLREQAVSNEVKRVVQEAIAAGTITEDQAQQYAEQQLPTIKGKVESAITPESATNTTSHVEVTLDGMLVTVSAEPPEFGTGNIIEKTLTKIVYDVKPIVTTTMIIDGQETTVRTLLPTNTVLANPITFRLWLTDDFTSDVADVTHKQEAVIIDNKIYYVDVESGKRFIELTWNRFSVAEVKMTSSEGKACIAGGKMYDKVEDALSETNDLPANAVIELLMDCPETNLKLGENQVIDRKGHAFTGSLEPSGDLEMVKGTDGTIYRAPAKVDVPTSPTTTLPIRGFTFPSDVTTDVQKKAHLTSTNTVTGRLVWMDYILGNTTSKLLPKIVGAAEGFSTVIIKAQDGWAVKTPAKAGVAVKFNLVMKPVGGGDFAQYGSSSDTPSFPVDVKDISEKTLWKIQTMFESTEAE